ncbi:NifB/NifX family molybdenum-iron cluster-binding protein [Desulfogranum mediterraneum]|uniref:NifB/NifX family molybdenum-iron cluster-binding protein n=1 Tax=Desulfogranum mediterraneum TaxID=160661 RepID=UPI00137802D7|nr:NifB/NifX family molybdenum-iron cluster-binding protein [Desulfogranum mediterraneum]
MTVWENRVSPVFDSARTLLIVELVDTEITSQHLQQFDPQRVSQLVQMLVDNGVMILICGAVSEEPAKVLEAAEFELIPFISGDISEVLAMLVVEQPVWSALKMPGCGRNICCRGKIRHGRAIKAAQHDELGGYLYK